MELLEEILCYLKDDFIQEKLKEFKCTKDDVELFAVKVLEEIKAVIHDDDLSDFDAIEKIVCIFEKFVRVFYYNQLNKIKNYDTIIKNRKMKTLKEN